ncbi:MAG: type II toxin-antitoxin system Phd/YefM family antitoxin [Candidatus Promineifilaceae bacterium]
MAESVPVTKVIGATEVRNNLGHLLNRVHRGYEQLVVEKLGIPVAAIISIKDYEHYRSLLAQELHKELGRQLGAAASAQGLTEEQLLAEMEEDRQVVYDELYGRKL